MSLIARFLRRMPIPALALPITALAMSASTLQPNLSAADRHQWQAGEQATRHRSADTALNAAILRRASAFEGPLGLPSAADRRVEVVEDDFAGFVVDEVNYSDAVGRPLAFLRLTPEGRLNAAVRLDYRETYERPTVTAADASSSARGVGASLGLDVPNQMPEVRSAMSDLMWVVAWPRVVAGVAVDGDGTTIRLWRSGDIHSVTVSERPLAAPASTIDATDASASLRALLPALLTHSSLAEGTLAGPDLRWVAPNDLYRSEGADAPGSSLRLAYVFRMDFDGRTAESLRALAFWIDAETGDLIGGDVLR